MSGSIGLRVLLVTVCVLGLARPLCAQAPVTIVFLADGWDAAHQGEFDAAWQEMRDDLLRDEPFNMLKGLYNFRAVFKPSKQHGCSRQYDTKRFPERKRNENLYYKRDTQYGLYYVLRPMKKETCVPADPGDAETECTDVWINVPAESKKTMKADVAGSATVVVVLTPDQDLNSGVTRLTDKEIAENRVAERGLITMTTRDLKNNKKDVAAVLAHELGHAVYRLGDEYSNDKGPCNPAEAKQFPNLWDGQGDPPWQHLIDAQIVEDLPAKGGMATCGTEVFHPTNHCRMLDQFGDAGFCAVCTEAMFHGAMEKKEIVKKAACEPPTAGEITYRWTPLKFTVHTREEKSTSACDPRYLAYWELNGKRVSFWVREAEADGAYYTVTIGDFVTPIKRTGTHYLRFCIADGALACKTSPTAKEKAGTTPWDSIIWTIRANDPPADYKIPWLTKTKAME